MDFLTIIGLIILGIIVLFVAVNLIGWMLYDAENNPNWHPEKYEEFLEESNKERLKKYE